MSRSGFDLYLPLGVRVTKFASERTETLYYGVATAKNMLEYLLTVLRWGQVKVFCDKAIYLGQVCLVGVLDSKLIEYVFTDRLQQCSCKCYCALWVI